MTTTSNTYTRSAGAPYQEIGTIKPVHVIFDPHHDLLSYVVPELTPDGTCSASKKLADAPYDLREILGVTNNDEEGAIVKQIQALHDLLEGTQQQLNADWLGIYQVATNKDGVPVLVKLAYQGLPSRAEFPLTEEFAHLSNNSTVGLTGKGVVIQDINEHGGAYYVCDAQVASEACLPIYNSDYTRVIGIVDAESFTVKHFNSYNLALVAKLCEQLSAYLPLKGTID